MPSGQIGTVRSIESHTELVLNTMEAGRPCGLTLTDDLFVERGDVATRLGEDTPQITDRVACTILWLGRTPLRVGERCTFKSGTSRADAALESIEGVIDIATLAPKDDLTHVARHDAADCVLQLSRALAIDAASEFTTWGRFVVVRDHEICGAGLIRRALASRARGVAVAARAFTPTLGPDRSEAAALAIPNAAGGSLVLIVGRHNEMSADEACEAIRRELSLRSVLAHHHSTRSVPGSVKLAASGDAPLDDTPSSWRRAQKSVQHLLEYGFEVLLSGESLTIAELRDVTEAVDAATVLVVWLGGANCQVDVTHMCVPASWSSATVVHELVTLLGDPALSRSQPPR